MSLMLLASVSIALADPPASSQSSTETVVVKKGLIHPRIDAEGYFEPVDPLEIRFRPAEFAGDLKIASVAAHGASVKKDDVLLSLETDDIQRQIATAEIDLANTKAAADKAQADVDLGEQSDGLAMKMQEEEVGKAKGALKWWEDVDGKQMITSAELQTRSAKAAVEDGQDELDQLKKMYKTEELTNATADIVIKRALRNLEINKVNQTMAEEHENKTKQFEYDHEKQKYVFAIDQQTNTLNSLKASQVESKTTRTTGLASAKTSLDHSQKKLDDLKKDLASFTIKAPADGIVYYGALSKGEWHDSGEKALRAGDKITAGQVVMTFFIPGKLRVRAEIPESQILWIKAGTKTRVVPVSNPQATSDGTCGAIVPVGSPHDASQDFQMPVELANVDPGLMPGEKASVQIEFPEIKDALIVPASAVQHGCVRIKKDEAEQRVNVITGQYDEKNIEIKSGLKENDEIVPN
ncbi:MAG TPA: HlyD family efflux transporter periplasmic adaptor subunit [Tepidisphaeraceae bacterium]|jgi:multidrug resistance efflux pump|nr:HlyD family efflux transporter periplasmic adaptor subunit [Tepidisphaeraceae bacterium]